VIDRDRLGEFVRMAWIEWAHEQPDPKPSWLVPYQDLSEADKEADRRIGEFVMNVLDKNYHPLDLYQTEVRRTTGTVGFSDTLVMASMGLAGETGEVIDHIKKYLFHAHNLDQEKLVKELGDVAWYLTALCNVIGVPFKEVIEKNVEKLQKRYPDGFSSERSKNREEH